MPYKDPEKRKEAQKRAHEKAYAKRFTIAIRRGDEAFLEEMQAAAVSSGLGIGDYLTLAAKEKLERDRLSPFDNVVAVTASPAELRTGITRSHRSRPRRRLRLGVIPDKPDKP